MAQVTPGKFFSGVPKFDGEGANHVTENELKFHVECSFKKKQTEIFLLENLSINVPYHRLTMTV
jgi:hypothetical protein